MKVFNHYNITDFNYDALDDGTIKDQVGQTEEKHINDCKHTLVFTKFAEAK